MGIKQIIVLATVAMMVVAAAKIGLAQLIEVLNRFGQGGGFGPPPQHPLPGDDSVIVLRRAKRMRE